MYDSQHSVLSQISQLVGSLDANQMRTLHQVLGEQLGRQGRMLPAWITVQSGGKQGRAHTISNGEDS